MRTSAFKSRLFMAYAAMTVALVVLFAVLLIGFTAWFNRETELRHQQQVFEANHAQVESFLTRANRLAMQVSSNLEILNCFMSLDEPGNAAGGGGNFFDDNLIDAIRVSSLLAGINSVDEFADLIAVYNRYGDYVSAGRMYETPERARRTLSEVSAMDAITEEIRSRGDHCLVVGLNIDSLPENPYDTSITLYRNLSYTDASTPYGLVSVRLNPGHLSGLNFWGAGGNREYYLIDDRHPEAPELLFSEGKSIGVEALYPALARQLREANDEGRIVARMSYRLDGQDVVMLASRPQPSNWMLVRALPVSELSRPYLASYLFMVLGCLMLLVVLLLVVNYMAERISRPLRKLSATISGIGLQNMRLPQKREAYSTEELVALDESFRSMLARLDQSIAVEMQAYMRVLQSQMNPHFLYNVLSVVIASSESAGDEHTASMCMKLTAMLRYAADIKRETVTLADEIENTRNYLDLMKDRYEHLFSYEIAVDDRALGVQLPRLTVQPLAENCFVHGFKNEPPWRVRVEARIDAERWRLRVEDNGVGMTPEQVEALFARLEDYKRDVAGHYQELSLGGMGLINTLLRLTLTFSEPIDYRIESRPEGGLTIEIGGVVRDQRADR